MKPAMHYDFTLVGLMLASATVFLLAALGARVVLDWATRLITGF